MDKLTTKEQQKYIVIQEYVKGKITRKQAAVKLSICPETVSALKTKYLSRGKTVFCHKNRSNRNAVRVDSSLEAEIVRLYKTEFTGFNFTHFYELICEQQLIRSSMLPTARTVFNILERNGVTSPVANRKKRTPNQHPIRPRRQSFGELVQLDASLHDWLSLGADHKITLHLGIDDATSQVY